MPFEIHNARKYIFEWLWPNMALNVSHFIWNLNIWQYEMLCHFYIRIHQGVVCYVPRSTLTCIFSKYTSAHSTNVSYLFLFLAVTFYQYTYLLLFFFRINGAKSEKIIVHWEKSLNLASDLHNSCAFPTWLNHKWITWIKHKTSLNSLRGKYLPLFVQNLSKHV